LQQKADVNASQADGSTALHWAVHFDDLEMVQLLIGAGANVKVGQPLRCHAAVAGLRERKRRHRRKADEGGRGSETPLSELGETPLMMAARTGNCGHGACSAR
jgi:ankyrin repeat protein